MYPHIRNRELLTAILDFDLDIDYFSGPSIVFFVPCCHSPVLGEAARAYDL